MACLREPVPSSVITRPSLDTPPISMGYHRLRMMEKFWGSCSGSVFGQSFLECPSPLALLFKLLDVSIGVSMEESFVGVFGLLTFLVCVVSLGAGDTGSSGLLDF